MSLPFTSCLSNSVNGLQSVDVARPGPTLGPNSGVVGSRPTQRRGDGRATGPSRRKAVRPVDLCSVLGVDLPTRGVPSLDRLVEDTQATSPTDGERVGVRGCGPLAMDVAAVHALRVEGVARVVDAHVAVSVAEGPRETVYEVPREEAAQPAATSLRGTRGGCS